MVEEVTHGYPNIGARRLHGFIVPSTTGIQWVYGTADAVSLCDKHESILVVDDHTLPLSRPQSRETAEKVFSTLTMKIVEVATVLASEYHLRRVEATPQ